MSDIVTLEHRQKRDNAADVITEVTVDRIQELCHADFNLIGGKELSRFCYIDGYRENGRKLPTSNPYGSPTYPSQYHHRAPSNGYVLGSNPNDWHEIPTASPSDV